ncbi:exosome component 10-like [Biomphalaria glabrata]|uniref:Exosome complex component 10 homolog n=1 Tax=Biomphalaria glabrata TaxID=6526 RepID=A0A9W2YPT3_BIOGL|nr:exosome component 10-like [Biomphalaria glabrata]
MDRPSDTNPKPVTSFFNFADVNDFSQHSLRAVLQATKSSNDLPIGDDFDFYSTFRAVRDVLDIEGQRILTLLQRLLRHQNVKGNLSHGDVLELEEQFDVLMDANDQILERAGILLDEASGIGKEQAQLIIAATSNTTTKTSSWNKKPTTDTSKTSAAYRLMTARNIQRPQLSFKDKIDNTNLPYKPQIRVKPHALKSLEESLQLPENVNFEDTEDPHFNYPHPYSYELESFSPKQALLEPVVPKEPEPLDVTPLLVIDTKSQLLEMLDHLKTQSEIAVDLEHHSYRTFKGLTCLMQISTRQKDYIIDTLALRNELYLINDVFTDPSITKVFHGADSDIQWLQRDFGVYVVNMFDTGQAARVLGFSRFSLAHLMMNYCHIEADKQFQLADWRIRPLPAELINYAREDTHYLLYIYDMMKNQLLERGNAQKNLLLSVYERSKNVAAKIYQKPIFTPHDYLELYKKSKKVFNNQQMTALKEVYAWRDGMARVEDESYGYVLPNHMLLQIAEILPRERQGVLACCNPIPPLVRQNLIELHNIILQARELAPTKIEKVPEVDQQTTKIPTFESNNLLSCPHDKSHADLHTADIEKRIMETGLITSSLQVTADHLTSVILKPMPVITALASKSYKVDGKLHQLVKDIEASFVNPFLKYLPTELKNPTSVPEKEKWTLKPSNVPAASKKKTAEIPVTPFTPEYVPPSKRLKTDAQKEFKSAISSKVTFKTTDQPESAKPVNVSREDKLETQIERNIKTLRQEIVSKKKKEKKNDKQRKLAKATTATDASSNSAVEDSDVKPLIPASPADTVQKGSEKKKKKKIAVSELLENFESFDYKAAASSIAKENSKKKKTDVFNPNLPSRSGKNKNKVKKPKLSGPKSNVSSTFGPSPGGPNKKRK